MLSIRSNSSETLHKFGTHPRCACTSVWNGEGRFDPQYDRNAKLTVDCDSVLLAAGQKVDLSFIEEQYNLALNRGLIKVEPGTQKTSRSGVFAGGDLVTGPSTVIMAIRTGRNAAEAIDRELGGAAQKRPVQNGFLTFDPEGAKKAEAIRARELSIGERALDKEDSSIHVSIHGRPRQSGSLMLSVCEPALRGARIAGR